MSEIRTFDQSSDPVIVSAQEEAEAEALAIGQQLEAEHAGLLAGKYKDAQELEKAYIELQRKLGNREGGEEGEASESEEANEAEVEQPADPQIETLWKANNEFYETGEISKETLAEFSKMSSTELVEAYMRLQQQNPEIGKASQSVTLSDADVNQIRNSVGGDAQYESLIGWAADNLPEAEIDAFNNVIDSGNKAAINFALQALQAKYRDNMGYEGEMLSGKAAQSSDVFRSQAELVRAMEDRRYDTDPAYRADIIAKVERSTALQF